MPIARLLCTRTMATPIAASVRPAAAQPNAGASESTAPTTPPLTFEVLAKCSTTKARVGLMRLRHSDVSTPVFMPVGTQGTLKGILPDQLENINCQIILGNTYHLGMRPVRAGTADLWLRSERR